MATTFGFEIASSRGDFHLTDSKYIRAGYIAVDTIAERDALPIDSGSGGVITDGSFCYVKETDKFYLFKDNAWVISENGKVDDIKVGDQSIVVNKVATLTNANLPTRTLDKISDVTATAAEVNVLDGIDVTTTELNYTKGATSNIQTQLNSKQSTIDSSHKLSADLVQDGTTNKVVTQSEKNTWNNKVDKNAAITGATKTKITYDSKGLVTAGSDLAETDIPDLHLSKITDVTATASEVNVLDGIEASTTELNYVKGVTSAIQTQLNAKEPADANILKKSHVINEVTSTIEDQPLSANMGKNLQDQIHNLQSIGRFLSLWHCETGLPDTEPSTLPYTYKTGDYFRVGTVSSATPKVNYKPNGDKYTGVASTTVETEDVEVGAVYYYDGSVWRMQAASGGKVQDVQVNGTTVLDLGSGIANITNVPASIVSGQLADSQIASATTWNAKQDALPTVVNDKYLHTNEDTGALEWSEFEGGGDTIEIANEEINVIPGTNTAIEANPSGEATGTLSKLLVDRVIYSVGGGSGDVADVKVDGTSVVDANKIAQISIVGKEDKANKVTTISSSSTDTEYPTAKAVFDTEQDIKEIAEGKTKSFVVSKETNPSFDTQDASFELSGTFTDINDVVHDVSELKLGDTVYVQETDVPDRWCSDPQEVIPVVPAPYVQQLYIDCEAGSYVDTGISSASVSADPKIETRFQMLSLGDIDWFGQELDGNGIIFDTNNQSHALYIRWASLASLAWNFEVGHVANELYFNVPYTLKITGKPGEKAKIYRDDILLATSTTNMNTMAAVKTITFNRGRASTGKGRWYSFKIYNGDTLAFNGIPARDADYHYGVYDTVSETFIQGTGNGITGLDLPQGVTFHKLETAKVPVVDVKMNSTSIVTNNVANIPVVSSGAYGVIKHVSGQGLGLAADGSLYSIYANNSEIEAKSNLRVHIAPGNLDKAVMEGLGNNSLTWSDAYKASARTTIGAVDESALPNVVRL